VAAVLYLANVAFNTVIIAMDVAIIFVAIKTREIFEQLFLWTILLCMGMDIAGYFNTVIHDVPSFAMGTDIFETREEAFLSVLVLFLEWYSQLFALLVLAALHFMAVFTPAKFRTILPRHMGMINLLIVLTGILFSVPMLTPYCGFTYLVHNHYWYYDLSKPYSYLYRNFNLALQTMCAVVVACADTVIIWKIRMLRIVAANKHTTTSPPTATVTLETILDRRKRINREIRVAVNFIFLSACFLIMTVVFNLPYRDGIWYDSLFKLTYNLNLSKWAIYSLENAKIRKGLLSLCRRRLIETRPSSVTTVTPAR
ncbi:hypothetical protein V3C99_016159, partial [Haemonchus contortus]